MTHLAPDCGRRDCERPARYQYEVRTTCSAGPYSVAKSRCEDHTLSTGRKNSDEYTRVNKVYGKGQELEMDPHYFCKKNGGEHCVDGYEETCPVHQEHPQSTLSSHG